MNKRVVLVAAAVLLALIGTFAVYRYAKNADERAVADTRATTVLVATKRVPAGTTWAEAAKSYVTTENMPVDSVPASSVTSTTDAAIGADAVAQSDIASGQIVIREAFGSRIADTGVLSVPKGKIALSVSLPANADVAGYVGSGAQVIVFVSAPVTDPGKSSGGESVGDNRVVTRTLVPRAAVIATSQAAPTGVEGSKDTASSAGGSVLVTLALSQHDAQRIVLAQKVGELYLGLLSASSRVSAADPGVDNVAAMHPTPVFVK